MSDRELRVCARRGHVLFEPHERPLRDRIHVPTALGDAWRCLRCGSFVIGQPSDSGPAERAPVPARGKALRQQMVLRLLSGERMIRGAALFAVAYALYRFSRVQGSLRRTFSQFLPAARPAAQQLGIDLGRSRLVSVANHALTARPSAIALLAVGVALYAALEVVEGVGLWLTRRWAEYLTVVATAAFLPLEVHELADRFTVVRAGAFVLNVAAVVYLVVAKRLFGVRGGRKRYEDELAGESLLEVRAAASGVMVAASPGSEMGMGDPRPA